MAVLSPASDRIELQLGKNRCRDSAWSAITTEVTVLGRYQQTGRARGPDRRSKAVRCERQIRAHVSNSSAQPQSSGRM